MVETSSNIFAVAAAVDLSPRNKGEGGGKKKVQKLRNVIYGWRTSQQSFCQYWQYSQVFSSGYLGPFPMSIRLFANVSSMKWRHFL